MLKYQDSTTAQVMNKTSFYHASIEKNKELFRYHKKKLHKILLDRWKKTFFLLDSLVVLSILMNFGALVLTNMMVAEIDYNIAKEKGVTIEYFEANPVAAKIHDLKGVEEVSESTEELSVNYGVMRNTLSSLYKQSILWAILLGGYIYNRSSVFTHKQLILLVFIVVFYFSALGYDFFHDFGMYIGKILYE